MESHAKYFWVGIIVVILSVGIVSAVLWIGGAGKTDDSAKYIVYFHDQSLDGLQVNSYVTMKGIKIGSVSSFRISSKNIEEVRVVLDVERDTPIKTDTRAVIRRNLLTGLAYIDFVGSSQQSPLLIEIPEGEDAPVILEGKSELTAIAQSVPNLMEKGGALFDSMRTFFSDENYRSVKMTLENLAKFSAALGNNDKRIDTLLVNSNELVQELRTVTAALERASADDRFVAISTDLAATVANTREATDQLDSEITQVVTVIKNSADAVVRQTASLSSSVSKAAENFNAAVERFEEPRAAILGPAEGSLGPGEMVKPAR